MQIFTKLVLREKTWQGQELLLFYSCKISKKKKIPVLFRQFLLMTNASRSGVEGFISVVESADKVWKRFF